MTYFPYAQIDFFGIVILLLFFLNQKRSRSFALGERMFSCVTIIGIGILLMDGVLWLLDGQVYPGGHTISMLLTTFSFCINPMVAYAWLLYCDLRVFSDEKQLVRRARWYALPLVLHVGMLLANLFTPLVFTIDAQNVYHRETFYWTYLMSFYLYLFSAAGLVIRKMTHTQSPVERREFVYMVLFVFPPATGSVIQSLFYGVSLTWPGMVVSIVIVYIYVLNRQITTDSLTGVNNRRMLKRFLDLKFSGIGVDSTLFLIMLDMDEFKSINDNFGHATGDRALQQFAQILKKICNHRECFLARLGGDEFIITGEDKEGVIMNEIVRAIDSETARFNRTTQEPYRFAASLGTARYDPETLNTPDALLSAADQQMYQMKLDKKLKR